MWFRYEQEKGADEMLTAEAIPYETFKQKIRIVKEELTKNRYVEVWDKQKLIYSAEKWRYE